jgi:predicted permease
VALWRQLVRGVRALAKRAAVDAELDEEVRDYFERARADLVAGGLTPEEAERVARRELGDLAKARETLRAYGWENQVDAAVGDFRHSLRRLRQNSSFSTVVVATLAVGIGVNVALFSLFQQILLKPLPAAEPEQLVNLVDPGPDLGYVGPGLTFGSEAGNGNHVFSYPMFRDLEARQASFAGIAAHRLFDANISLGDSARRVRGFFVSGSYFPVLGLQPALGRLLGTEDDRVDGEADAVVLSYAYWRRELAGDPDVVGRKLTVNGRPLTIVGVAPRGFHGTTVGVRASVFVPITFAGVNTPTSVPNHDNRAFYWVYLFARLAPGVQPETAATAINRQYRAILTELEVPAVAPRVEAERLDEFRTKRLVLEPGARGQSAMLQPIGARLETLFVVSAAILLLCCANIAGLMLIRASGRIGEMAVRASMGASRARLAGLLLTESLLLAVPAAVLSLPVALLILRGLAGGVPDLPSAAFDVDLSAVAAAVAIGAALVAALVFGVFPARDAVRADPARTLHAFGVRQTSSKRVTRFRAALATTQVALSMALLAITGVFAQSLANIGRIDIGVDVDPVVTFTISPEGTGYEPAASAALFDRLEDELAAIPGVRSAGSAQIPLLAGGGLETGTGLEGNEARIRIHLNQVGAGLFETLGVRLLAGRDFSDADRDGAPPVAIVNQRLAERLGLGAGVVGRRIQVVGRVYDVIGLVPDFKDYNVTDDVESQVFLPRRQATTLGTVAFYVRGDRPAQDLVSSVRETVARLAPTVPILDLRTMREQVRENLAEQRFFAGAATAFAVLATALAALGLYGVLAYSVAQRSREIALRFALGAPAARIRAMVVRQVGAIAVVGVALGAGGALLLGRAARSLLFGVEAANPVALAGAAAVLTAVMLAAAYVPARRASRIDPMVALRYE